MQNQNQILTFPNGHQYQVIKKIGEGQFGSVYKAADQQGNFYALKYIKKSKLESEKNKQLLINELMVMKKVSNPYILKLLDQAEFSDVIILVTVYCNKGNLKDNLEIHEKTSGQKGFGEQQAIFILQQIIEGFKSLKSNGYKIMHRDLKLANIFVNDNQIVIGDFGFAKLGESLTYTKLGTPLYMAPEVLQFMEDPKVQYDSKCDIWSIGVCFYELIFGIYPFVANNEKQLLNKMLFNSGQNLKFPKNQKISIESQILLKQMLESNPKQRKSFQDLFNMFSQSNNDTSIQNFQQQNFQNSLQNSRFKNSLQSNNLQFSQSKRTAYTENKNSSQFSQQPSFQKFQFSHNLESQSKSSYISNDHNDVLKKNLIPYFYYKNLIIFMIDTTKKIESNLQLNISQIDVIFKVVYIVLLQRSKTYTEFMDNVLKTKNNYFQVQEFNLIISSRPYQNLQKFFQYANQWIQNILQNLSSSFQQTIPKQQYDFEVLNNIKDQEQDEILLDSAKNLLIFFRNEQHKFNQQIKSAFIKMIMYIFFNNKIQKKFPMKNFQRDRDWKLHYQVIEQKDDKECEQILCNYFKIQLFFIQISLYLICILIVYFSNIRRKIQILMLLICPKIHIFQFKAYIQRKFKSVIKNISIQKIEEVINKVLVNGVIYIFNTEDKIINLIQQMFNFWDFQDILKQYFIQNNGLKKVKIKDISQFDIFIDALELSGNQVLPKIDNLHDRVSFLKNQFKEKLKGIIFEGQIFQIQKEDILAIQNLNYMLIKTAFLFYVDTVFSVGEDNYKQNQDQFVQFSQANTFFKKLEAQKNYRQFQKIANSSDIPFFLSPDKVEYQFIKQIQKSQQSIILGSTILSILLPSKHFVCYKITEEHVYLYDLQTIANKHCIPQQKMKQIIFWCFFKYCSINHECQLSSFSKILIDNTSKIKQGQKQFYANACLQLDNDILKLNKIENLEINKTNLIEIKQLFELCHENVYKVFKQLTESYVYDQDSNSQNYMIFRGTIQEIIQSKTEIQDNFMTLKFNNIYSFEFQDYELQKKFLILRQSKNYIQSNELSFLQNKIIPKINERILRTQVCHIINCTISKVIIKKLYRQEFQRKYTEFSFQQIIEANKELCDFRLDIQQSIFYLLGFQIQLKKHKNKQKNSFVTFSNILFLHQLSFIDFFKNKVSPDLAILKKFSENGFTEEGIIIIKLIQYGFFNEKSFLQEDFFHQVHPKTNFKGYQLISDEVYKKYKLEIFGEILVYVILPFLKLYRSDQVECKHKLAWEMVEKNPMQSMFLYHEVYRKIFYKFISRQYQFGIKEKEIQELYNIYVQNISQNYETIYFISQISIFIKNRVPTQHCNDQRFLKYQSALNLITQTFHSVMINLRVDLAIKIGMNVLQNKKRIFKNMPFTRHYQNNNATIIKEIIVYVCLLHKGNFKDKQQRQPLIQAIKDNLRIYQQEDSNIFDQILDLLKIINTAFFDSQMDQNTKDFKKKVECSIKYLKHVNLILNLII